MNGTPDNFRRDLTLKQLIRVISEKAKSNGLKIEYIQNWDNDIDGIIIYLQVPLIINLSSEPEDKLCIQQIGLKLPHEMYEAASEEGSIHIKFSLIDLFEGDLLVPLGGGKNAKIPKMCIALCPGQSLNHVEISGEQNQVDGGFSVCFREKALCIGTNDYRTPNPYINRIDPFAGITDHIANIVGQKAVLSFLQIFVEPGDLESFSKNISNIHFDTTGPNKYFIRRKDLSGD